MMTAHKAVSKRLINFMIISRAKIIASKNMD